MLQESLNHGMGTAAIGATQADCPRPSALRPAVLTLDWVERTVVLVLYAWLALRVAVTCATSASLSGWLLLLSEGIVVVLVLIRRGTADISQRPIDWLLAFTATTAPLLVRPGGTALLPASAAAATMLVGFLIQVHAKFALGRSFGCVAANRGLRFSGPYRFVRHPMYLGYLLTHIGFLCTNPTAWNCGAYALCYAIQIPRLLCEERLLFRDRRYRKYARSVRFRLIPGLF